MWNRMRQGLAGALMASVVPSTAWAQEAYNFVESGDGASVIWIFANISYAGMRAQNHPSVLWRIVSFVFGFPGTLVSLITVEEGKGSLYGIQLPTANWSADSAGQGSLPDSEAR